MTGVDKAANKIAALEAGQISIYEPGLDALVAANVAAGQMSFSIDLAAVVVMPISATSSPPPRRWPRR